MDYQTLAQQMANAAGEIARRYFRAEIALERKKDASPVTLADRECESAMRALIEAHYPEHGIFGEEFGMLREEASLQWVLDPIDGTRSFIAGYPLFCTLIALTENGVPQLGVIDQPILKERWTAIRGQGAQANGKQVHTRDCRALADAFIATTSTDYFTPQQASQFAHLKQQCASSTLGGDAYAYAMLASGRIDLVVDCGMKPYDYCALAPIIEEAGGVITDWDGRALHIASNGQVLAAATPQLHALALEILKPSSSGTGIAREPGIHLSAGASGGMDPRLRLRRPEDDGSN